MGAAAGVPISPAAMVVAQRASIALVQMKHAAVLAHLHTAQMIRIAERYYAIVDESVISRVQKIVEREVLRRVQRLMDEVEVMSKLLYVKHLSTTSVADAYDILIDDVTHIQINKRQYEVHNCGPELMNVPTLNRVSKYLELRDRTIISFLLTKCLWTKWQPPPSWRLKVDQVYDLTIHVRVRRDGFHNGELRVIKLRIGRKWVGPHHLDSMDFGHKCTWLHRVDFETRENVLTAESDFYRAVKVAWTEFLEELARIPKPDLRCSDETGDGFPYDEQEKRSSLRVKYLVETSIENVMQNRRTMFRSVYEYEQWRMEQEDKAEHQTSQERSFAGPLLNEHIDTLAEHYEEQAMAAEDVKIWFDS